MNFSLRYSPNTITDLLSNIPTESNDLRSHPATKLTDPHTSTRINEVAAEAIAKGATFVQVSIASDKLPGFPDTLSHSNTAPAMNWRPKRLKYQDLAALGMLHMDSLPDGPSVTVTWLYITLPNAATLVGIGRDEVDDYVTGLLEAFVPTLVKKTVLRPERRYRGGLLGHVWRIFRMP